MVISLRSTLREPSNRTLLVMWSSMLAAMPFMTSNGLAPAWHMGAHHMRQSAPHRAYIAPAVARQGAQQKANMHPDNPSHKAQLIRLLPCSWAGYFHPSALLAPYCSCPVRLSYICTTCCPHIYRAAALLASPAAALSTFPSNFSQDLQSCLQSRIPAPAIITHLLLAPGLQQPMSSLAAACSPTCMHSGGGADAESGGNLFSIQRGMSSQNDVSFFGTQLGENEA